MESQPSCSMPGTSASQNQIPDQVLMADLVKKLQDDPQSVEKIRQFISQRQREGNQGWFAFLLEIRFSSRIETSALSRLDSLTLLSIHESLQHYSQETQYYKIRCNFPSLIF